MAIVYARFTTGANLYFKPHWTLASSWSTGVLDMAPIGATGFYSVDVPDNAQGSVFVRAGGSPAVSDIELGQAYAIVAPTASAIATQTRTELADELADIAATKALVEGLPVATSEQIAVDIGSGDWEDAKFTIATSVWQSATRTLSTGGVSAIASAVWATIASGSTTALQAVARILDLRTAAADGVAEEAQTAAVIAGTQLTGPNAILVTVTDSDTSNAIEGATVRLYRTGATGSQTTNDDGQTTFGLTTATWSWIAAAPGYESQTGTLVVSGDGPLDIELVSIVVVEPDDPALATLTVKCLDETNQPEPGAKVYVRIVGIPAGSTGLSFDGISQDATANAQGNATLTIVKLAKYQIRRGGSQQWKDFTAGSGSTQTITSFIGVDPA
jgi:hypothetical protein